MHLWATDKAAYFSELKRFVDVHRKNIAGKTATFRDAIEAGPVAVGRLALKHLQALGQGADEGGLKVARSDIGDANVILGMCGELRQIENLEVA